MTLRRLLAVTHEATVTGAPMNLLHLLTWIREETDIETHLLVVDDGPLRHRFEQITEVTVLDQSIAARALGLTQLGLRHLGSTRAWRPVAAARLVPQLRHLRGFDLVYLNSLTSLSVSPYLPANGPVVSHVHELEVATRTLPSIERGLLESVPSAWIAASDAVRRMLVEEVGLLGERVLLHYEYVDPRPFERPGPSLRDIERMRREVGVPSEAAVVMGAGTIDWRKGPDLFVQVATEVRRRTRDAVSFLWVGGHLEGSDWERVSSDIRRAGADHVRFLGFKTDPRRWFALADVFALTSREDPFPLVCLEHALLSHPIVTYRNGGMVELLAAAGPDAATGIVDHLDVGSFADRVISFLESDRRRSMAGAQLRERVSAHHTTAVSAPALIDDLERVVLRTPLGSTVHGSLR